MQEEIVSTIKEQYSRDLRKQIVKSILTSEKSDDKKVLEDSYKIINQIFAYIISELKWSMSQNTDNWDDTPLKIMIKVFPKIETTQWFQGQQLTVDKSISIDGNVN